MTEGDLKRRVLLAGVLTLAVFLACAYALASLDAPEFLLLGVVTLVYLLVTRPLMAPVREALRLRRRLAYQAYLETRADGVEP